jgi:FkbM family methyltransferase
MRFRPGTSDENVWIDVFEKNEYRLPAEFKPGDTVVDIGGHIGVFSRACYDRKASRIIAFEPEPYNFALYRENMADAISLGVAEVHQLAIAGDGFCFREHSGHLNVNGETNAGGGFLYGPSGEFHVNPQYVTGHKIRVPTIGIAEALEDVESVALLKVDCEGSEWSIFESRGFAVVAPRVDSIVGEYHERGVYNAELLINLLAFHGFNVTAQPHPGSELGLFWAKR